MLTGVYKKDYRVLWWLPRSIVNMVLRILFLGSYALHLNFNHKTIDHRDMKSVQGVPLNQQASK